MTAALPPPAILGGKAAVSADQTMAQRWPILDADDEQAVIEVLRDGNISTNRVIRSLEADYARFADVPYALAHCNGTAALHAAFFSLDLQPGDEVLVPSATFWASVLPIVWMGAVPVFCESEPERVGIDPSDIERKITKRSRAIVVVHLWGLPSKMTEIFAIAKRHNLKIVEDASHAHGAKWRGRPCGSLGDVAVFSLQGDKLAPAGEGGVLLTSDKYIFERACLFGDITRIIELETPDRRFAATSFGMKTRIAPLSAAVGRVQLRHLAARNAARNANLTYLSPLLEALGFHTFLPPPHIERTYFEFLIRIDPTHIKLPVPLLIAALRAEGCNVALPRYPLVHQQPFFTEGHFARIARLPPHIETPKYDPNDLPVTRAGNEQLIKLPSFPRAERVLLDQYAAAFAKVIEYSAEIAASEAARKLAAATA
jgi:perosamine synthetase